MAGPMGRMMAGGGPENRSIDFKVSGRRLLAQFKPERLTLYAMLFCVVLSVGLNVVGPKILGQATDLVFAGIVGRQMPAGASKEQVLASMRERGDGQVADMLRSTDFTPGEGIDFTAVGHVLLFAVGVFLVAGLLMAVATRLVNRTVNRTMFRMREDVQTKLSRLPLSYFDKRQRGEVLSRATNDIDNIGQTLQQSMGQLINSLLTIIGVLAMMFWVSWLLALVALVTVPLSFVVATRVGKRSQPHFVQQWRTTGKLNAHIEEMYTGHNLVKVFGRQDESAAQFAEQNDALYEAGFKAQFNSGVMQPLMMFVSNINYVLVAVVGGLRVASGALSIGDVQAFIQYSRQFSMPLTQVASMANLVQSGVASAERVFELLDAEEQEADPVSSARPEELRGRVALEHVSFRYDPEKPLIEDLSLKVEPGHTVAIVGPTGAGKTTLVNLLMRFYDVSGGRITLDGVDIARMSRDDLRAGIGMVLQDTWLFGGTIAENIAYGASREVTPGEIEGGGPGGPRGPVHPDPPRRLRHRDRRRGQRGERGREAAHHHCPGVPFGPGDPGAGRGDVFGGHPYGGPDPEGDGETGARPHVVRHRPPPLDDPGRGHDPGHGERLDRRTGHPHRPVGGGRGLRTAVQGAVRAGGGRGGLAGRGRWEAAPFPVRFPQSR